MPWQEVNTLTLRTEFVELATKEGRNMSELCSRFGISRDKGYKWLRRYAESGAAGLLDLSRKPHCSPHRIDESVEAAIIALRNKHPKWGARKLKARLEELGHQGIPAPSTITVVLQRNGLIDATEATKHKAFVRFEHPRPNDLWQMDYKGHFVTRQGRCHPLTVLDDHSRFNVLLQACADETTATVQAALTSAFRKFGLPYRMTMDNGSPWGGDDPNALTPLTVWLIRIGVQVSHSRPYHPQTQGKDERFHRTLKSEAIAGRHFEDLADCQRQFDQFRSVYNLERPHEALAMKPPITRYEPSVRPYPEVLPPIEYGPVDQVRKVQDKGEVFFKGAIVRVSRALKGQSVAFRPANTDGTYEVYFCHQRVGEVQLADPK